LTPGDERPHAGLADAWWFDVAGEGWGAYARLEFRPAERVAWWWAAVVGREPGLVMIRADDLRIPARGMEVRGDGIWACLTCETPLEHWSVGLECYGVALDDPRRAWGDERGDLVPFGLDLEWEAVGPAVETEVGAYEQWCRVSGEVLLGDDRVEVDAGGWRCRAWGGAAVPGPGWRVGAGGWRASGTAWPGEPLPVDRGWSGPGWPGPAEVDGRSVMPVAWSPVHVPGRQVAHALCLVEPGGWGWGSWVWPDEAS
jgi:hypothetical protein